MKTITRTYTPHDENKSARQFECRITDVMGGHALLEVSVWEVRNPLTRKWWQSRTAYYGSKNFWLDDFPSIKDGIDYVLTKLMEEEEEDNLRRKKIEEFENGG